ncbi:nitroreductase family protein [Paenibacillus antri]|uniref:Nitroreductase family protein n=1 Tax=Paenibacillus antri TaxID=2582848 RepID=A0A5R9GP92_9BACL|nr:nitroreductase family protein [Paenibacillus antri]TLS54055.1 nitroreductase family protein [Paenibacillus antri]
MAETNRPDDEVREARPTAYEVHPNVLQRWSPRAFDEREVPEELLFGLFEAARYAPSANNEQPWRYVLARTKEDREAFYEFINEGNRSWCERAPALALLAAKKTSTRNGNPMRTYAFDAGASWATLALEATNKGLVTHAMGGFDAAKAKEALGFTDDYEPMIVIAIGYRGDPAVLTEGQREREKPSPRKPLSEIVHEGKFTGE